MKKKLFFIITPMALIVLAAIIAGVYQNSENNIKLNVEKYENYIMKFVLSHPLSDEQYIFFFF